MGLGERNVEEAVKRYKLAADKGMKSAQNNIGNMYEYGNGK